MSYADAARKQWEALVEDACNLPERGYDEAISRLAEEAGITRGVLKRKCDAIRYAYSQMPRSDIVATGQQKILGSYIKHRKKYDEKKRRFVALISSSLYDALVETNSSPDSEEAFFPRLRRVLGLKTYDDVFDFILSALHSPLTDKDLVHLAGGVEKKKRR